jgi:hypothetical protein
MLVVLLWLLTSNALSQTPGPVQISGQIIDQSRGGGLGGVAWRVKGVVWRLDVDEALTSGMTDANGFFNIKPAGSPKFGGKSQIALTRVLPIQAAFRRRKSFLSVPFGFFR